MQACGLGRGGKTGPATLSLCFGVHWLRNSPSLTALGSSIGGALLKLSVFTVGDITHAEINLTWLICPPFLNRSLYIYVLHSIFPHTLSSCDLYMIIYFT